jgi:hypothetical protein
MSNIGLRIQPLRDDNVSERKKHDDMEGQPIISEAPAMPVNAKYKKLDKSAQNQFTTTKIAIVAFASIIAIQCITLLIIALLVPDNILRTTTYNKPVSINGVMTTEVVPVVDTNLAVVYSAMTGTAAIIFIILVLGFDVLFDEILSVRLDYAWLLIYPFMYGGYLVVLYCLLGVTDVLTITLAVVLVAILCYMASMAPFNGKHIVSLKKKSMLFLMAFVFSAMAVTYLMFHIIFYMAWVAAVVHPGIIVLTISAVIIMGGLVFTRLIVFVSKKDAFDIKPSTLNTAQRYFRNVTAIEAGIAMVASTIMFAVLVRIIYNP